MSPSRTKGMGVHALLHGVHALALEDDDHSGAGGASVERLYHALGFELFDDEHLVVDQWSELVCSVIEPRAIAIMSDSCGLSGSGMVTASDAGAARRILRRRLGWGSENAIAVVITVSVDEPRLVRQRVGPVCDETRGWRRR